MNKWKNILIWFLIAPVLVTPARRVNGGELAAFQLREDVKVDGSGIFLTQLVMPTLHATLPTVRLAPAPVLGQTNSFTRQQIIDLAKDSYPEIDTTNWSGPPAARVSRRARRLGEAELTDMLRAALQENYVGARGALEIHLSRPWQPVEVPEGPLNLQLTDVPAAGVLPSLVAGFELWCDKERAGVFQVPMQARIWREVPVAHSPIMRGQLLADADIVLEKRDALTQREACIPFPVEDKTLESVSSIQAGAPVWARCARERPILHRGQLVEAVFQDGSMMISLKVETLEEGAIGQMVRVRNPKTRRELYGKIQNQDLILITL